MAEARSKAANKDNFARLGGSSWNANRQQNSSTIFCARCSRRRAPTCSSRPAFPPAMKVDGKMTPVSQQPLTSQHTRDAGARDHERQAGGRVRGDQGMQLRDQPRRHRPLPRQCLHAAWQQVGMVLRTITTSDSRIRRPQAAAGAEGRGHDQARPGAVCRRHRFGQVDLAGGDDRLPQREHATATSSPSKTRSNTCTRTATA